MNRHIAFGRLHNFRDLGGYQGADGRSLRWSRLYRSDSLAKLDGADWDRFLGLGIRTAGRWCFTARRARTGPAWWPPWCSRCSACRRTTSRRTLR